MCTIALDGCRGGTGCAKENTMRYLTSAKETAAAHISTKCVPSKTKQEKAPGKKSADMGGAAHDYASVCECRDADCAAHHRTGRIWCTSSR